VVNPHNFAAGVASVEVLRNTFADNDASVVLIGDAPYELPWYPDQLRTTFAVSDNTIIGNGPDAAGRQFGILILAGASGEVKRNIVTDHAYTGTNEPTPYSFGIVADDDFAMSGHFPLAALQPVLLEANILRSNQVDLLLLRGDRSTIVNNFFEGAAPGRHPAGLGLSGDGVLVGTNRFCDLETGILLLGDDPEVPNQYLGVASNAMLIANGFCNVVTNLVPEDLASYSEDGTLRCPPPTMDIQLSWPDSYNGYSVQTAPTASGPWTTSDATPFLRHGENRVVIPAENGQQFFRLRHP